MTRQMTVAASPAQRLGTLRQEWIVAEADSGLTFELTCGAGLGSPYLYMHLTFPDGQTVREQIDIRDLAQQWAQLIEKERVLEHEG